MSDYCSRCEEFVYNFYENGNPYGATAEWVLNVVKNCRIVIRYDKINQFGKVVNCFKLPFFTRKI